MKITAPFPQSPCIRVLLIDDDEDDYQLTKQIARDVTQTQIKLDWLNDYETALEVICQHKHDVYLIDYRLGLKTGIDLLNELSNRKCTGPFILLTGLGESGIDQAAQAAGADDFIEKSRLDPVLFERMIRYVIRQHANEVELEQKVNERTTELEKLNQELRELDRRKDIFLATLAHELRNPLAPIRHALELQKLMPNNQTTMDHARAVMERQLLQLVRLIDDLLSASRMNRDSLSLNLQPVDLRHSMMLAIETSQPIINKAGLSLNMEIPNQPLPTMGDHIRLAQVFTNILNNSSKYTPRGGSILLSLEVLETQYRIRVADNGIGISKDDLKSVFDLFTQINHTNNRQDVGLGIGLALVKRLVESHGGIVTAESPGLNQGTTITVLLPIVASN